MLDIVSNYGVDRYWFDSPIANAISIKMKKSLIQNEYRKIGRSRKWIPSRWYSGADEDSRYDITGTERAISNTAHLEWALDNYIKRTRKVLCKCGCL